MQEPAEIVSRIPNGCTFCFLVLLFAPPLPAADAPAAGPATGLRDTLIFVNGDVLQGRLDREVSGTVFFQSDELGAISVPWAKIKSLHTQSGYVVLGNKPGVHLRHTVIDASQGTLAVSGGHIEVSPGAAPQPVAADAPGKGKQHAIRGEVVVPSPQPIPVGNAQFILDEQTFDRQVRQEPNLLAGWNGSATGGVTLVQATENQYIYTSGIALVRTVPTVSWLAARNRTTADFLSSYGRITQPAYISSGTFVPAAATETSIFHADAERDQYVSSRTYALTQTAFDHNFSQGLALQQVYGLGFGVTVIKRTAQQLDLKASLQYERQQFITSTAGTNQNLVGSTVSGTYMLTLPRSIVFHQQIAYVPAFNVTRAYSANEQNTLTFPFYKSLAFTVGTIDSYLNDPELSVPPTTRNSFQFTTGVTYTVKSKY